MESCYRTGSCNRAYQESRPVRTRTIARNVLSPSRRSDLAVEDYESELTAYERLKDLQGSAIPCLIMAGQFLPSDERAIRPPALVLEYVPSVSLYDVPFDAITPTIREQVLSAIERFPLCGVLHNDITLTNIHFTPPEKLVKGVVLGFGLARIRCEGDTEEVWTDHGASDVWWARRPLEDRTLENQPTKNT